MKLYINGPRSIFRQTEVALGYAFPDPEISFGSSFDINYRINKVQFGNGYTQRSMDGINNSPLVLNFTYRNRSLEVITELKNFFNGEGTVYDRTPDEYFYYIPPAPLDGGAIPTYRKFTCEGITLSADQSNNYTLSGVMTEVFEV